MEIDRELLKGSVSLVLLSLLSRGEMYGYEILQEASRRSANGFALKEGTLYPALHQLEKRDLIKAEWRTGENGRERKYYALTAKGRSQLIDKTAQWRRIAGAMARVLGPEESEV